MMAVIPALFSAILLAQFAGSSRAVDTVVGTYVDSKGINWSAKPPTPIVDVSGTAYSHVYVGFYLPSLKVCRHGGGRDVR